jgi:hypothetical protein
MSDRTSIDANVEAIVKRILYNPLFFTLDPFKTAVFNIRRKERLEGNFQMYSSIYGKLTLFSIDFYKLEYRVVQFPRSTLRRVHSSSIPIVQFGDSGHVDSSI